MLATLVIFARESLEASMIVAILLSYLKKTDRQTSIPKIWLGVALAVAMDTIVAVIIFATIHQYQGTRMQTVLEGITYLIAAALLTLMSFWMKRQSRSLKHSLEKHLATALGSSSSMALILLAVVTVGREGLETVFFMIAIAFRTNAFQLALGALAGLVLGLGISYWIYRLGRRVPLTTFFNVFGVLLLIFGASLLADGVQNFQSLGWIPFGRRILWNTGTWLNDQSAIGDILHTFFGYSQSPSMLQFAVYVGFVIIAIATYLNQPSRTR